MAHVQGDGDGDNRRRWIIARIAQIRSEFDDRAQELGGLIEELDRLEQPQEKRHKRLPPGWEVITGGGAIAALVAAWGRRHWRPVAAAAVSVAGAAFIAGALLAHGAPPPRHGATGPTPRQPTVSTTASVSAVPTASAGAPSSTPHKPGRTLPPPLVAVPSRGRRPPGVPSGAAPSPAGPSPTPTRPGPSPTTSPPPPSPFACPAGLLLQVLGIGLFVCV